MLYLSPAIIFGGLLIDYAIQYAWVSIAPNEIPDVVLRRLALTNVCLKSVVYSASPIVLFCLSP